MTTAERDRLKRLVDNARRERELWRDERGIWRLVGRGSSSRPPAVAARA